MAKKIGGKRLNILIGKKCEFFYNYMNYKFNIIKIFKKK